MQYIAFLTYHPGVSAQERQAAQARRAAYQFPPHFKEIAEYWVAGSPQVVVVFQVDVYDPIMKMTLDWQDLFDISIHPCVTAESGLQISARVLQGRG